MRLNRSLMISFLGVVTMVGALAWWTIGSSWRAVTLTRLVFPAAAEEEAVNGTTRNALDLSFVHIPKTGGTSIELWGKANGFKWGKYDKSLQGDKKRGEYHCNKWHTPQALPVESFCVVRQPFDRLQSEFRHRTCQKDADMSCDLAFFNAWARQILSGPLDANDCHVLPQTAYLDYCDHVLAFDELQDQFTQLLASRGFPAGDTTLEVVRQPRRNVRSDCDPDCTIDYDMLDDDVRSRFEAVYDDDIALWRRYTTLRRRSLRVIEREQRRLSFLRGTRTAASKQPRLRGAAADLADDGSPPTAAA
mmetsp:Transcript_5350/g.13722  ORF Transcript_5350/g.13722 Transcript_5350/m.13722 type:complete len:305 (-) Transcript_5350:184-1098(-)